MNTHTHKPIGQCMLCIFMGVSLCVCALWMWQKQTTAENEMTQNDEPQFLEKKLQNRIWFRCVCVCGCVCLFLALCVCEYVFKAPFNLLLKRLLNFSVVCSSVLALYLNGSCDLDLNSGFSKWTWLCHNLSIEFEWIDFIFGIRWCLRHLQWTFFIFSLNSFYACL